MRQQAVTTYHIRYSPISPEPAQACKPNAHAHTTMSRSRLPSDQRPTCSYPIQPSLNKKNEKDEKKKMSTAPFNLFATLTTPPSLAVRYSCPTHSRSPPFWHMHHPLAHHPLDPLAPTQPARADPSSCPATLSVPSHTFTLSPPTHSCPSPYFRLCTTHLPIAHAT